MFEKIVFNMFIIIIFRIVKAKLTKFERNLIHFIIINYYKLLKGNKFDRFKTAR